jgi:hypothetical protein
MAFQACKFGLFPKKILAFLLFHIPHNAQVATSENVCPQKLYFASLNILAMLCLEVQTIPNRCQTFIAKGQLKK